MILLYIFYPLTKENLFLVMLCELEFRTLRICIFIDVLSGILFETKVVGKKISILVKDYA